MPRIRPERKAERREQILAAARTCFARDGFHRTTLHDVLVEAGLSAGCVYSYFKSKDELILAIADERHEGDQSALSREADAQDPAAALRQIAGRFYEDYLSDRDEKRRIAVQTWSEAMLDPAVLASVREWLDAPIEEIAVLIARGRENGLFPKNLDPRAVARALVALFHGAILQKLWEPERDMAPVLALFERLLEALEDDAKGFQRE